MSAVGKKDGVVSSLCGRTLGVSRETSSEKRKKKVYIFIVMYIKLT